MPSWTLWVPSWASWGAVVGIVGAIVRYAPVGVVGAIVGAAGGADIADVGAVMGDEDNAQVCVAICRVGATVGGVGAGTTPRRRLCGRSVPLEVPTSPSWAPLEVPTSTGSG